MSELRALAAAVARIELAQDHILELLEALLSERSATRPDPNRAALLQAVFDAQANNVWCVSWIVAQAGDPDPAGRALRRAIDAAVGSVEEEQARRLGSFVPACLGRVDGWCLERAGKHRDGVLYRVSRLEESQESRRALRLAE